MFYAQQSSLTQPLVTKFSDRYCKLMSFAGRWFHSDLKYTSPIDIQEDGDDLIIDCFILGNTRVPTKQFYCNKTNTAKYSTAVGTVQTNAIHWSTGEKWFRDPIGLPEKYTAVDKTFPDLTEKDNFAICFNIKYQDMTLNDQWKTDPFFHWRGTYFELQTNGVPKDDKWSSKLSEIADETGIEQVKTYVSKKLGTIKARVFWSPGKVKRWGKDVYWTGSEKRTTSENLLVRKDDDSWQLHEIDPKGNFTEHDLPKELLSRITYTSFKLVGPAPADCAADIYIYSDEKGMNVFSEAAWINGSTVVRKSGSCEGRQISYVPSSFKPIRYVPFALRANFLAAVHKVPSCGLTGATLMPDSLYASPFSKELAHEIGKEFGRQATSHNVRVMSSASMRGHMNLMSADHDFTQGFCENRGCQAVHFKGSNMVALHGEAWEMEHGVSYMLEEEKADFSNHAKEAALMASLSSPKSISFLANGGPTVAINLCRMLLLCGTGRVFTFTGLHGKGGTSGASGAFKAPKEKLEASIAGMRDLAPDFFTQLKVPTKGDEIVKALESKPLRLLNWENTAVGVTEYILRPDAPNKDVKPGVPEAHVEEYATECAKELCKALYGGGS